MVYIVKFFPILKILIEVYMREMYKYESRFFKKLCTTKYLKFDSKFLINVNKLINSSIHKNCST